VGISNNLELVWCLGWLFLIMFLMGIPSIVITFIADPDAATEAEAAAGQLVSLLCCPLLHVKPNVSNQRVRGCVDTVE
jgi:hypothetical protein